MCAAVRSSSAAPQPEWPVTSHRHGHACPDAGVCDVASPRRSPQLRLRRQLPCTRRRSGARPRSRSSRCRTHHRHRFATLTRRLALLLLCSGTLRGRLPDRMAAAAAPGLRRLDRGLGGGARDLHGRPRARRLAVRTPRRPQLQPARSSTPCWRSAVARAAAATPSLIDLVAAAYRGRRYAGARASGPAPACACCSPRWCSGPPAMLMGGTLPAAVRAGVARRRPRPAGTRPALRLEHPRRGPRRLGHHLLRDRAAGHPPRDLGRRALANLLRGDHRPRATRAPSQRWTAGAAAAAAEDARAQPCPRPTLGSRVARTHRGLRGRASSSS